MLRAFDSNNTKAQEETLKALQVGQSVWLPGLDRRE